MDRWFQSLKSLNKYDNRPSIVSRLANSLYLSRLKKLISCILAILCPANSVNLTN